MAKKNSKFIQKAIQKPGSLRAWAKRKWGNKAFSKQGKLNKLLLRKALKDPKITEGIKRKIRLFLNVLSK